MKTFVAKSSNTVSNWYIVDAKGKTLGRLASKLVCRLRGKYKVEYTPHVNIGDYLVVINAEKIIVTGKKYKNKIYYHHTGYSGGIKKILFKDAILNHPEKVIQKAVKGMLPKGSMGRSMIKRLKIYKGNKHNHSAQNIICLNI